MTESETPTRPDNERPELEDIGATVVANEIASQLSPFLERQEERDLKMFSMFSEVLDKTLALSHQVGRIEARLELVESGCKLQHPKLSALRQNSDDDGSST